MNAYRPVEYINRRDIRPITPEVLAAIVDRALADNLHNADSLRQRCYEGFRVDDYIYRPDTRQTADIIRRVAFAFAAQ